MMAAILLWAVTASASPQFEAVAQQARAAREANRVTDAIALYQQAVALKPAWAEGWWYAATLLYDRDRYADAASAFARFTKIDPKSGPGWSMLGLCEFKLQKWNEALEHLDRGKAAGLPEEGEVSQVARYHRALLDTHFGRFEAALDELKKFTLPRLERPAIIQAIGVAALRKPLLPEELAADDRPLAMRVGRAVFDSWAAQSADAAREFEELELTHPDNPHVRYLRGSFLLQGKPEEGLQELHKCLELDPKYVPAMLQIAFESLTRGDAAEGIRQAENAVKLAPDSFVAHNALGRLLITTGDLERATAELQRAVQLAPENPECRFALASAYTKANRKQDAARENTEFLRLQKLRAQADNR